VSVRRIRKRDGSEAAFEPEKIRRAVAAAQAAVGDQDAGFAAEVRDLVEFALRRRYALRARGTGGQEEPEGAEAPLPPETVPDVEEIQDLVEEALIELGRSAVAKAYILYRDRRARVRAARSSSSAGGAPAPGDSVRGVRVREARGSFPWSKARIVAALVNEAGLARAAAEDVARRVEARVLSSGIRRLPTGLIRELVDNELYALGLEGALARQAPVALPRHDLRQWLSVGPPPVESVEPCAPGDRLGAASLGGAIEREVLARYVLADVLDERSAELHLSGDLQLEDLGQPHLHLVQSVPCELLLRGQPGPRTAFECLDELAALAASVSRGLVLESPGALLAPLVRGARGEAGGGPLAGWLLALRALAHGLGLRIDLARPGARSPALLARLVEALDQVEPDSAAGGGPRLFLERDEIAALRAHAPHSRAALERLLAAGALIPTWCAAGQTICGPGCFRRASEQGAIACGAAVALNLARIARRSGPWREDEALERVARRVEDGVEALAQLTRFQRDQRAARSGEARGRVACALVPVGLAEMLRILADGELRPEQGARVLGLIYDAALRFAARRDLSLVLTPFFGERAAARFARIDAERPRVDQPTLFGGRPRSCERARGYTSGFDLGPLAHLAAGGEPGEAEALLCATVPGGAWIVPAGADRPPAGVDQTPLLDAWERFGRTLDLRRAPAGSGSSGASAPDPAPSASAFGGRLAAATLFQPRAASAEAE